MREYTPQAPFIDSVAYVQQYLKLQTVGALRFLIGKHGRFFQESKLACPPRPRARAQVRRRWLLPTHPLAQPAADIEPKHVV